MAEETTEKTTAIRGLNDDLRTGKSHNGQIMITAGINELGSAFKSEVAKAVAEFDAFTSHNDPHLEHDFGSLEVQGHKVFFKFDYYDPTMKMLSPDPSDPVITKRVLTIMLAEEY
jgi:hypothetical protein